MAKEADGFVHQGLSTDVGLSRCLIIYIPGNAAIHKTEVDNYLSVSYTGRY